LRRQFAVVDDPSLAMPCVRTAVQSKIRHQVTLIQRFASRDTADAVRPHLELMRAMRDLAPDSATAQELMGVEGAAARAYFEAIAVLLPEPLRFAGRSRRPPMDVFNSAIGYAYAILPAECVSALVTAGLDPGVGMLHRDDDRRPNLALDLMEEFRPLIVDQAVVRLCRSGGLNPEHGQTRAAEPGVFLTKAGKKVLIDAYERRMLQVTSGALAGFTGSMRRHVYRQAQRLAAFIDGREQTWTGLSWR
jgi:CRISPR-associated protein Cas1